MDHGAHFLAGVIEGFYGEPWSQLERFQLFERMRSLGLNTYLYAPKDDLNHRAVWREPYDELQSEALRQLTSACREWHIRFIYGLSPGLDIRYSSDADLQHLRDRFAQLISFGCSDFALLFDDIPDNLPAEDAARFGSFASAQCHVTNAVFRSTRDAGGKGRFLFCPTPYCGRMARRQLGGAGYLETIGRELSPEIDIFWTGPEIISPEISVEHILELTAVLRRKPVIWDNLHANDYDGRRFYCGPYSGRAPELRRELAGILINPNCESALNEVPMRTFAEFISGKETYQPRAAYLRGLHEWLPEFATIHGQAKVEDLVLFGDCYYLPHEDGCEAQALFAQLASLLAQEKINRDEAMPLLQRLISLKQFCASLAELRNRELLYALSRRAWELREELDLLIGYIQFHVQHAGRAHFESDFHLPGTYRGGFVARLQSLLTQNPDGTFEPASNHD